MRDILGLGERRDIELNLHCFWACAAVRVGQFPQARQRDKHRL